MTIPVIYKDNDVLVISKPAGLMVHAFEGVTGPNVAEELLRDYPELEGVGEAGRWGIVHRLDKEVAGLMIIARTKNAYEYLVKEFAEHRVEKIYQALVYGAPRELHGVIEVPLERGEGKKTMRVARDGKGFSAKTEYTAKETYTKSGKMFSLLDVSISTGRRHQIRVHLAHMGHPIVGDTRYGFKRQEPPFPIDHIFLVAYTLKLCLPSGKEQAWSIPPPEEFSRYLEQFSKNDA